MQRAEILIFVAVLVVGGLAFGIEKLGADAARGIALGLCSFLVLLMVVGMTFRARAKKAQARALAAAADEADATAD